MGKTIACIYSRQWMLHHDKHIVMLHQAHILLGYHQLLDQRLIDGKRRFAEKTLGGRGHQRTAGDAIGQHPLPVIVHIGLGDADLVFIHGHIVVLEKYGAEGLIVGQGAAEGALADLVVGQILDIHVHEYLSLAASLRREYVDHGALGAVDPAIEEVHI